MKSILLIGMGRFGRHMAEKLLECGSQIMVVEQDEQIADDVASFIRNVEIGDARNESYIESLGVDEFDACVVTIGDDFQAALEITVLLKDHGAKYVVARAKRDVHKKLLLRNGADYVMYAEREMAERMAVRFGQNNIFDYIELGSDFSIYEIGVPKEWVGHSIRELSIRPKYHITVLAVKANDITSPTISPDHIFSSNETIFVLGDNKHIKPLIK